MYLMQYKAYSLSFLIQNNRIEPDDIKQNKKMKITTLTANNFRKTSVNGKSNDQTLKKDNIWNLHQILLNQTVKQIITLFSAVFLLFASS